MTVQMDHSHPRKEVLVLLEEGRHPFPFRIPISDLSVLHNILLSTSMLEVLKQRNPFRNSAFMLHTALRHDLRIIQDTRLVSRQVTTFVHLHLEIVLTYILLLPTHFAYSYAYIDDRSYEFLCLFRKCFYVISMTVCYRYHHLLPTKGFPKTMMQYSSSLLYAEYANLHIDDRYLHIFYYAYISYIYRNKIASSSCSSYLHITRLVCNSKLSIAVFFRRSYTKQTQIIIITQRRTIYKFALYLFRNCTEPVHTQFHALMNKSLPYRKNGFPTYIMYISSNIRHSRGIHIRHFVSNT